MNPMGVWLSDISIEMENDIIKPANTNNLMRDNLVREDRSSGKHGIDLKYSRNRFFQAKERT